MEDIFLTTFFYFAKGVVMNEILSTTMLYYHLDTMWEEVDIYMLPTIFSHVQQVSNPQIRSLPSQMCNH